MSAALERYLAQLYTSEELRTRFCADPVGEAERAGLPPSEQAALQRLDLIGLELAAQSFAHKRAAKAHHAARQRPTWLRWLDRWRGG